MKRYTRLLSLLLAVTLVLTSLSVFTASAEDVFYEVIDGETIVNITELDKSIPLLGTYKVTRESGAEMYKQADTKSEVLQILPHGTYHITEKTEGTFIYTTYNGISGYVSTEAVHFRHNPLGEYFITSANSAVEALSVYNDQSSEAYLQLKEELAAFDELLKEEVTQQQAESGCKNIDELLSKLYKDVNGDSLGQEFKIPKGYRLYGDVYYDNILNLKDLVMIQYYLALLKEFTTADKISADVDASEKINMLDATTFQKYCAKFFSEFDTGFMFHLD